jgi:hypothetical protein
MAPLLMRRRLPRDDFQTKTVLFEAVQLTVPGPVSNTATDNIELLINFNGTKTNSSTTFYTGR